MEARELFLSKRVLFDQTTSLEFRLQGLGQQVCVWTWQHHNSNQIAQGDHPDPSTPSHLPYFTHHDFQDNNPLFPWPPSEESASQAPSLIFFYAQHVISFSFVTADSVAQGDFTLVSRWDEGCHPSSLAAWDATASLFPNGEYGRMGGYRGQPPGSGRSGQFQRLVSTGCVYIGAYIRVFWNEVLVNSADWSVGWCEMATAWDVVGRVKSMSILAGFGMVLSE